MKLMSSVGVMVMAGALSSAVVASGPAAAAQSEQVTLTGCAVKGSGDGDGFLLVNSVEQTTRHVISPDATGAGSTVTSTTSREMKPARILYWLDDDDDVVERLMGQLVEVKGEVEGEIQRGEIEVERENGMIELEINAAGRKANVKLADVPSAVGTSGSVKDREEELAYVVRKLDVESARSIAPTCGG